ncbi:hypothetical protein [Streptomyces lancefieldiae]|uniref:Uncharacterized protein n=1 Tax=Streptomyces lancefieldiae TaxID=3075520 RepID=A0ABU3B220_9ACTN|nr:hypothetical protein [Streptomyces sp. DSM 40712]MDT0616481.1 hypothetical protein [Streptomyces sp. DSM 40712]
MTTWLLEPVHPRHVLEALRIVPLIIVTILLAPAWSCWIFLPRSRQELLLDLTGKLITWTRATRDTPQRR